MNAFYYRPQHVGMEQFPPGYFKLDGFEITHYFEDADCLVLPCDIRHVADSQILALPYLKGKEQRHVFFSLSEYPTRALPVDGLAFRTDFNHALRLRNGNSRAWCWGVEDLKVYAAPPETFLFDVHAQMWASSPITDLTVESCRKAGLKLHDQRNDFFYGTLETNQDPRLAELRESFLKTMRVSKLVLVPRSRAGVNRYRFYEAMSMGRVPVLLCDDCLLACDDKIDYTKCSLRINERDAVRTGAILKDWLQQNEGELRLMGQYGREMWQRWLNPALWEQTWGELTREYLEELDGKHRTEDSENSAPQPQAGTRLEPAQGQKQIANGARDSEGDVGGAES